MTYAGGLRFRLIRQSFTFMLRDAVADLGWFDTGRAHAAVTMRYDPVDYQTEILPNCIAISDEDINTFEDEIGSNLSEHRWSYYVDVYAEDASVGIELSNDIKSILEGRLPSIGRPRPNFTVYDYTQATPPAIFVCDIEDVTLNRGHAFQKSWERYWYSLYFEIVDHFGNEDDDS